MKSTKPIILHVDDDEANRYAVKLMLERAGYVVWEAATGNEGLKLAEAGPDLMLLDIRLPDISGFEVCRRIKADQALSGISVLQTSAAFTSSENRVEGLDSGADGYLVQPIDGAVLEATVRSLLRMRLAEKKAQAATAAREEMLAIVSHDLRNPLAAIMLQVRLLQKSLEKNSAVPDLPDKLERITRSCNRMNRLIQDILDVSSIEAGQLSVKPSPFSARELMHEALNSFEEIAQNNAIELEHNEAPEVQLHADRERIMQVLMNLISNAVKFTPEGGKITLSMQDNPQETILSVMDTGTGISKESLPHIFNRFWQGRKERGGGVGLGLSIVKGIVDAHKGRIWVESELNKGTTFSFALPKS